MINCGFKGEFICANIETMADGTCVAVEVALHAFGRKISARIDSGRSGF